MAGEFHKWQTTGPDTHVRQLSACAEAAWIVDPVGHQILDANALGCARFGWSDDGSTFPVVLDGAMPAFARLRHLRLQNDTSSVPIETDLLMWTARGAERVACEVTHLRGAGGILLLVVEQPGRRQRMTEPRAAEPDELERGTPKAPSPPATDLDSRLMEDAATLRAIAEQIRGTETRATPPTPSKRAASDVQAKVLRRQLHSGKPAPQNAVKSPEKAETIAVPMTSTVAAGTATAVKPEPRKRRKAKSKPAKALPKSAPTTAARNKAPTMPHGQVRTPSQDDAQPVPPSTPAFEAATSDGRLARLAHELKTPLSAIATAAEIMRDQQLGPMGDARYLSYAADIHGNAQHLLGVIERMLNGGDGGMTLAPERSFEFTQFDLNILVERTASAMRPLAAQRGLAITTSLAHRLPHIIADATSVRQILINLVTNALKFTPAGGRIDLGTSYAGCGPVDMHVSDTGQGMSPADCARAQAGKPQPKVPHQSRSTTSTCSASESPTRPDGCGSGIGFPLIQTLARGNGAKVLVDSQKAVGTVVTISFPKSHIVPV